MSKMRVAILGAGSVVFGKDIITDMLLHESLRDCELRLMDVDPERLALASQMARSIARELDAGITVRETSDRLAAIDGADFVICTINAGGLDATHRDLRLPAEFGLRQTIGDSLGVGGISRAARSIPILLEIADEMERLCPEALLINYTNPMAMNMLALQRGSKIRCLGLCHGVQYTARTLRTYVDLLDRATPEAEINAFMDEVARCNWRYGEPWTSWVERAEDPDLRFLCVGINHMAFVLHFASGARDLYPAIREVARRPALRRLDSVRFELFDRLGYFMTETAAHTAEYVPWIMRHDAELARLEITPDLYLHTCRLQAAELRELAETLRRGQPLVTRRKVSNLHVSRIMNAIVTGVPHVFNGNIHNADGALVSNLPGDCCVEVPCVADRLGIRPAYHGALPPQCAALIQANVSVQDLAVRGIMEGRPDLLRCAVMMDPNTAATLTLPEIDRLCERMFGPLEGGRP